MGDTALFSDQVIEFLGELCVHEPDELRTRIQFRDYLELLLRNNAGNHDLPSLPRASLCLRNVSNVRGSLRGSVCAATKLPRMQGGIGLPASRKTKSEPWVHRRFAGDGN